MSDDRIYPPGVVPATFAILSTVLVVGVLFGLLLGNCSRPEPIQMIPTPMPAASSAAIATSSASAMATQSVRVTVRRPSGYDKGMTPPGAPPVVRTTKQESPGGLSVADDQGEAIVIEVSQSIAAAATSSAQASASMPSMSPEHGSMLHDHGHLGVIAATMPGILAADLQLVRVDVSPATRWLVAVPLEVGLDVVGNLESGGAGVSIGSKAFAVGGAWSRWNLANQGWFVGVGLRF